MCVSCVICVIWAACVFHWCASRVFPTAVLRLREPPRLFVGVFFVMPSSLFSPLVDESHVYSLCVNARRLVPNYQVLRCFATAWVSVALQGSVLALFVFISCTSNVTFSTTCRNSHMIVGLVTDGVDPENWCKTLWNLLLNVAKTTELLVSQGSCEHIHSFLLFLPNCFNSSFVWRTRRSAVWRSELLARDQCFCSQRLAWDLTLTRFLRPATKLRHLTVSTGFRDSSKKKPVV